MGQHLVWFGCCDTLYDIVQIALFIEYLSHVLHCSVVRVIFVSVHGGDRQTTILAQHTFLRRLLHHSACICRHLSQSPVAR